MSAAFWTHPSVLALAKHSDPVETVLNVARNIVLKAIEDGWQGPPFDPFELARLRDIEVTPREDVDEALLTAKRGRYEVNYNPQKPRTRVRFSVAHEIAHTIFPDCEEKTRFRNARVHERKDDWQLETLCNLAAAEFLMPIGSFPEIAENFSMGGLLKWRREFGVSTEAMLLRSLHFGMADLLIFSASTTNGKSYSLNYALKREGAVKNMYGKQLRADSPVSACTAIGYTEKGFGVMPGETEESEVECVGVAPYPGSIYPRVIGFARPHRKINLEQVTPKEVRGDALSPRDLGTRLLVHVVNDRALSWGAGFGKLVATRFPQAARGFKERVEQGGRLELGEIFSTRVADNLFVVQLVAQHGYGEGTGTRLRYVALKECLTKVAKLALEHNASLHMPRIGTGFAGGSWMLIREIIDQEICRLGIPVTIYSLGDPEPQRKIQPSLF